MSSGNLFKAHPEQDTISAVCADFCLRNVISEFVVSVVLLLSSVVAIASFVAPPCVHGNKNIKNHNNCIKEEKTNLIMQSKSIRCQETNCAAQQSSIVVTISATFESARSISNKYLALLHGMANFVLSDVLPH